MKNMQKVISFLTRNDGIWSIPLSFLLLIMGNVLLNKYFGEPIISLEYIQPLFVVAFIMVSVNAIAYLGGLLNHKDLQDYYYSDKVNTDIDRQGRPYRKVFIYLGVYFFYFIVSVLLFVYVSNLWFK